MDVKIENKKLKNKRKLLLIGMLIIFIIGFFLFKSLLLTGNSINGNLDSINDSTNVTLIVFYGEGCPHCSELFEYLEKLKEAGYNLIISSYEIRFNEQSRNLFEELSKIYDQEIQGVPTMFIGEKVIIGYAKFMQNEIREEIDYCIENNCINPLDKLKLNETNISEIFQNSTLIEEDLDDNLKKNLTIPAVIFAAIVDSINPCAFAVLILLVTTILISKNRKKALFAGLAFSLSIFISYFLMGLGLYSAIQAIKITRIFYFIVAIFAIIIGLFNLKDYFWYGKWFIMEVPLKWRPKLKKITKNISSVPGAFIIGILISLFLLPCTSGPYIVILGLLANLTTKNYAILLLVFYNLIFIIPMLILTFGFYFGLTTTERVENWRKSKLRIIHLISGIILLCLGFVMISSLIFGWI